MLKSGKRNKGFPAADTAAKRKNSGSKSGGGMLRFEAKFVKSLAEPKKFAGLLKNLLSNGEIIGVDKDEEEDAVAATVGELVILLLLFDFTSKEAVLDV